MRKTICLIVAILMVFTLASCSAGGTDSRQTEATVAPESLDDVPEAVEPNGPSDPLKIFWLTRKAYNPLATYDISGQAVNTLLYQGLFTLDQFGLASGDLAESFVWSEPHYRLTVLFEDIPEFADGNKVSADDILYSLNQYAAGLAAKFGTSWKELTFSTDVSGSPEPGEPTETDPDTGAPVEPGDSEPGESPEMPPTGEDIPALQKPDYAAYLKNPKDGSGSGETDGEGGEDNGQSGAKSPTPTSVRGVLPQADIPSYRDWQAFYSLQNIRRVSRGERETITFDLSEQDATLPYALTFPIVANHSLSGSGIPAGTGPYAVTSYDQGEMTLTAKDEHAVLQTIIVKPYRRISEAMQALSAHELDLVITDTFDDSVYRHRRDLIRHPFVTSNFLMLVPGGNFAGDHMRLAAVANVLQADDTLIKNILGNNTTGNLPYIDNNLEIVGQQDLSLEKSDKPETLMMSYTDNLSEVVAQRIADNVRPYFTVKVSPVATADRYRKMSTSTDDLNLMQMDLGTPVEVGAALRDIASAIDAEMPELPAVADYWYAPQTSREPIAKETLEAYRQAASGMNYIGLGFMEGSVLMNKSVYGTLLPTAYQPYRGIEDLWVGQDGSYLSP